MFPSRNSQKKIGSRKCGAITNKRYCEASKVEHLFL
jgi:hypothetical protein